MHNSWSVHCLSGLKGFPHLARLPTCVTTPLWWHNQLTGTQFTFLSSGPLTTTDVHPGFGNFSDKSGQNIGHRKMILSAILKMSSIMHLLKNAPTILEVRAHKISSSFNVWARCFVWNFNGYCCNCTKNYHTFISRDHTYFANAQKSLILLF